MHSLFYFNFMLFMEVFFILISILAAIFLFVSACGCFLDPGEPILGLILLTFSLLIFILVPVYLSTKIEDTRALKCKEIPNVCIYYIHSK